MRSSCGLIEETANASSSRFTTRAKRSSRSTSRPKAKVSSASKCSTQDRPDRSVRSVSTRRASLQIRGLKARFATYSITSRRPTIHRLLQRPKKRRSRETSDRRLSPTLGDQPIERGFRERKKLRRGQRRRRLRALHALWKYVGRRAFRTHFTRAQLRTDLVRSERPNDEWKLRKKRAGVIQILRQ
jgi:hypothetical protein